MSARPSRIRLALLGAAGPAGVNFLRSWLSDPALVGRTERIEAFDSNAAHEPFLRDVQAMATNSAVPFTFEPMAGLDVARLRRSWEETTGVGLGVELLIHAQPDPLALALASLAAGWLDAEPRAPAWALGATCLPPRRLIAACQDKLATATVWRKAGLGDAPVLIESPADVRLAEEAFGSDDGGPYPFWLRARHGAGARGAACVRDRREAEGWAAFCIGRWGGVGRREAQLVAHRYLAGRDCAVSMVYDRGRLVASMERERLEYLYPQHSVSGRTGTPVVARLVRDDDMAATAQRAVAAVCVEVGESPHGAFSVDLRARRPDAPGDLVPTEINCGRFFTSSHVGLGVGLNLVALWAAVWRSSGVLDPTYTARVSTADSGTIVTRHIDAPTVWTRPDQGRPELWAAVDGMMP